VLSRRLRRLRIPHERIQHIEIDPVVGDLVFDNDMSDGV
jgi:hypothetical protein